MSLTGKAVLWLQKTFPNADFITDIVLQDDGNGPYIKYWGISDPQPTIEEANTAAEAEPAALPPMPSDHDLLMMLYNDKKNNTTTFVDAIDAAKGIKKINGS